jgi:DNA ligase (NAD+)
MDGIGEKLVEQMLEQEMIQSIPDLYRLQQASIENMERMGEKSALNVLDELAKTKTLRLGKFLHALGLPGIGPELATSVAQHLHSIESVMQWVDDAFATSRQENFGPKLDMKGKPYSENQALRTLCTVEGIGSKVAIQVRDGLSYRLPMLLDLTEILEILDEPKAASGGVFEGMTFCLTGALEQSRKEAQLVIKAAGGKIVGSVSSQLSVLIAGEKAGSKLTKAQSLGVTVWTEQDFSNALLATQESVSNPKPNSHLDQSNTQPSPQQPSLFDFD